MSIIAMFKRCIHCHRQYSYNPSCGDLGLICPRCGKVQLPLPKKPQ